MMSMENLLWYLYVLPRVKFIVYDREAGADIERYAILLAIVWALSYLRRILVWLARHPDLNLLWLDKYVSPTLPCGLHQPCPECGNDRRNDWLNLAAEFIILTLEPLVVVVGAEVAFQLAVDISIKYTTGLELYSLPFLPTLVVTTIILRMCSNHPFCAWTVGYIRRRVIEWQIVGWRALGLELLRRHWAYFMS
ncbi:hypothetical protein F5Y16DRAFT_280065 [Xylariaceae sp. FL0255]|nr:hypothetical protein F5Y16DRAFT_280065 [Xylariaceae sp. FL0255]